MSLLRPYEINIVGLSDKVHEFDFELDKAFFDYFAYESIEGGEGTVHMKMDKNQRIIVCNIVINSKVTMLCDRSLEPFDEAITIEKRVVYKYGEEEAELDDDIYIITESTEKISFGEVFFDFIALEIPFKKLHPKFRTSEVEEFLDDDEEEGELIFTSGEIEEEEEVQEEKIDPRWESLKKFKTEN